MLSRAILCLGFATNVVLAQWDNPDGEDGPANSTTPISIEGEITIHTINVGSDAFFPNSILANPDDKVMFVFHSGNHSVIQSMYGWPCIPREAVNGQDGFNSDFFPTSDADSPPTWNLTIHDTNPIFFYCGAPGSCVNKGMLGVINSNGETNLTKQIELAKASKYMLEFDESLAPAASASLTALAASVLAEPENRPHKLPHGAIAGIAVGGAAGLALVGTLLYFWRRSRKLKKQLDRNSAPPAPFASGYMSPELRGGHISYFPPNDPRSQVASPQFSPLPAYQHDKPPELSSYVRSASPYSSSPEAYVPGWHSASPPPNHNARFSTTSELGGDLPHHRHELDTLPRSSVGDDGLGIVTPLTGRP